MKVLIHICRQCNIHICIFKYLTFVLVEFFFSDYISYAIFNGKYFIITQRHINCHELPINVLNYAVFIYSITI